MRKFVTVFLCLFLLACNSTYEFIGKEYLYYDDTFFSEAMPAYFEILDDKVLFFINSNIELQESDYDLIRDFIKSPQFPYYDSYYLRAALKHFGIDDYEKGWYLLSKHYPIEMLEFDLKLPESYLNERERLDKLLSHIIIGTNESNTISFIREPAFDFSIEFKDSSYKIVYRNGAELRLKKVRVNNVFYW